MDLTPMAIHRALVPLDGSQLAEATLPIARGFAKRLGVTINLLHVLEQTAPATVHGEPHLLNAADAEAYLARIAGELRADGISVETHVHDNPEKSVIESLADHAEQFNPDLILLASHGSGGVRGFLYGGVAQQVLRRGKRPVLMVHAGERRADGETWTPQTIAVPISERGEGAAVLPIALAIAQGFGATIQLIRVVPTLGTLGAAQSASAMLVPAASRAILDIEATDARRGLDELIAQLAATGTDVPVQRSVLRGDPATAAVAEATRVNAGLLAMATHAKAGLSGIWAGSVGTKIIDRSKLPLLLVRLP